MGPDIHVEPYLEAVVEAAREVLGAEFVGAYAAGSLALNAFQPGRYRPVEVIEDSLAARSGEPPPSGRQARAFQKGVLKEIRTAP